VAIGNADSGGALVEELRCEVSPFFELQAHPLADFNKVMSNLISALKSQGR
jgi:hypothetical protein